MPATGFGLTHQRTTSYVTACVAAIAVKCATSGFGVPAMHIRAAYRGTDWAAPGLARNACAREILTTRPSPEGIERKGVPPTRA
jgi:hypothetical protein